MDRRTFTKIALRALRALHGARHRRRRNSGSPERSPRRRRKANLCSTPQFRQVEQRVIKAFNKRFPEIKVEMVRAQAAS
jgi:iron(III) transport system substrate-binding protein